MSKITAYLPIKRRRGMPALPLRNLVFTGCLALVSCSAAEGENTLNSSSAPQLTLGTHTSKLIVAGGRWPGHSVQPLFDSL